MLICSKFNVICINYGASTTKNNNQEPSSTRLSSGKSLESKGLFLL